MANDGERFPSLNLAQDAMEVSPELGHGDPDVPGRARHVADPVADRCDR